MRKTMRTMPFKLPAKLVRNDRHVRGKGFIADEGTNPAILKPRGATSAMCFGARQPRAYSGSQVARKLRKHEKYLRIC